MKKRLLIFSGLLFLVSALAIAQTITITSPRSAGGERWCRGQSYTISWSCTGTPNPTAVDIILYQGAGGAFVRNIALATPNDGSYPWPIPAGITPGTYRIRISAGTARRFSVDFPIADCTPPATMAITAPRAGDNACIGGSLAISWTRSGTLSATANIILTARGSTTGTPIARNIPNNGAFSWPITAATTPGSYTLTVQTADNRVQTPPSPVFSIDACAAPARPSGDAAIYVINAPGFGYSRQAHQREQYSIGWLRRGIMQDRVSVTLMQGLAPVMTIAESAWNINPYYTNSGNSQYYNTYDWIIPDSVAPGQYTIRVRTVDTLVSGTSDRFTINGPIYRQAQGNMGMTITSPRLAETWCMGRPYDITWTRESNLRANVNINLINWGGGLAMEVARNVPNSGSFRFTPPLNLQRGGHRVVITTVDNMGFAHSELVNITRCEWQGPPTVRLLDPMGPNIVWCVGRTYTIRWITTNYPGNVRITLVHYVRGTRQSREYVLAGNIPDSGSFPYRVPTSFSAPPDQPYTCTLYVMLVNDLRINSGVNLSINTCVAGQTFLGGAFSDQQDGWLSLLPDESAACPKCVMFDLTRLNKLLGSAPEPYAMALLLNNQTLVEFGQLGQGKQLSNHFKREFSPNIAKLLLQGGKGYELVFKDLKGQVVFRKAIKLAGEKTAVSKGPTLKSLLDNLQDNYPLAYAADFDPGCPTCLRFDLREINKQFAEAAESVQVVLFSQSKALETLASLGKGGKPREYVVVKLDADEFKSLTGVGKGYALVFKNSAGKSMRRLEARLTRKK